MLIVLPPSELKAAPPSRGAPVDIDRLSFPELTDMRRRVTDALVVTSAGDDALQRLLVGASLADEVERNTRLLDLPAMPAIEVYRGVLYDSLAAATLSECGRRGLRDRTVIVSPVWGVLRPSDRIPPYRCHVCARLVGLDALEPTWRPLASRVLGAVAEDHGVVVEVRSSGMLAMGRPTGAIERTVDVRVRDLAAARTITGHRTKAVRGEIVRCLLESAAEPDTPERVAAILAEQWDVVLHEPSAAGKPWLVDVGAMP